jgi:hypothetical protein
MEPSFNSLSVIYKIQNHFAQLFGIVRKLCLSKLRSRHLVNPFDESLQFARLTRIYVGDYDEFIENKVTLKKTKKKKEIISWVSNTQPLYHINRKSVALPLRPRNILLQRCTTSTL